nr:zinc knuckle CX2CX4HX4C [Tanacetum cinerariifolium]
MRNPSNNAEGKLLMKASIDDVAALFGVPLNSLKNIDEFTKDLEVGKYDLCCFGGGPWWIHKSPIILKKWSMDARLLKEELTRIPIWVKLHDVPIQVFEDDGISLIATFIGKPVMLDSYTEADFVDVVTTGIPSLTGEGFTKEIIRVEYELRSSTCDICDVSVWGRLRRRQPYPYRRNDSFPKGCNSSFIALIPKVLDAKFVSDFRPISLIGCVYNVITKVLANRLMEVISDLVSDTQSAFVSGRQILDGPFILDELL